MLLVDDYRRQITSVRPEQLQTPFLAVSSLRTLDDAREFLARFEQSDASLHRVLAGEAMREGWFASPDRMTGADLVTAAARGIAARRLQVVAFLRDEPAIRFDDRAPYGDPIDAVVFHDQAAAAAFVAALQADNRTALDRALGHEAAWNRIRSSPTLMAGPGAGPSPEAVASLLTSGELLLQPVDVALRVFKLAWRRLWTAASSAGKAASAAPPPPPPRTRPVVPPPPPPPKPPEGPRSILPPPPSFASPQAGTLIEAAKSGVPFCEECAKRATELA